MTNFLTCPHCGSTDIKKNGKYEKGSHKGEQSVKCKKCGYKSFVTNFGGLDLSIAPISKEQKEIERERYAKHRIGTKASDATREKMSVSHMEQPGFWTGKTMPQSICDKMSESHMGQEPWNKGIPSSEKTCKKQSESMKGIPKPPRSEEHCKKISDRNSGGGNPMFDKKHTPEALEKIHVSQLGNTKSLGRKPTLQMSLKLSNAFKGDKSHFWKGGVTPLRAMIRVSLEYKLWKRQIFERDDFTCEDCGHRGGYLHAHHIKPFSQILEDNNITTLEQAIECEELWSIDNGTTLCKKCHKKKHFS